MEILDRIKIIIDRFTEKNIRIALAESCTGGYISHMITNISGSSKVFDRGVVSYSNLAKIEILGVNSDDIKEYGAVSKPVAEQMAEKIRLGAKVDIGIGVTGIAGPTGATPEKPLGLVYIGFSTENKTFVDKYIFKTDRINFKKLVLGKIIDFLENFIS